MRMERWISVVVGSVLVVLGSLSPALSQTAPLVGGGLTALPKVTLGPNQLKNAGFETVSGNVPTSWSTGTGLALDQLVKHSGTFSYRATGKFTTISQQLTLKKGIYKLSGWVRTQGVGTGTTNGVRLQFDLRPTLNEWKTTAVISGTQDWTLYELGNLVATQDGTVTIKLENFNNAAGTAWFDDIKLEEQQGSGIEVFLLHPNFRGMLFDDQPQAMRFDLTVTPPGGDFSRYRVNGTLNDEASGQAVATQTYAPTASFVAELDGGAMQMGRPYLATFALVDASSGATVATYPAYRVSRAPAAARAAMNVAFDDKNRVLVRGVPRFVLGVYDSRSSYSTHDEFWESQLWSPTGERRMDGLKINFYLNYWYGEAPADAMKALMSNLQKHGVMYLQTGNCFNTFAAGTNFQINSAAADTYVRDLAHPGLAGYYTIDECLSSLIPGAFTQYDRLRRVDPDSVTFSTNFGTPELALWRDSADILSTDPYPLYGAQPAGGYNHGEVGEWTALTRDTVKDARPIMTVLQFFKFTSQGRFPTLAEMRNHAWMAIVEGARGLWWWSLGDNALTAVCSNTWCAERTGYMNNLKSVVNEIADLEPALLADDAPGALAGNTNPSAIRTKVKLLNGQGYVFAYNTTNAQASATFSWNTAPGTVTVNAEHRTIGASGTSFTDSFGPFQAHVYVLGTGGSPGNGGGTGGSGGGGGTTPGAPVVSFVNPPSDDATVTSMTTVTLAGSAGSSSAYTYQVTVDGATVYTGTNPSFSWNTATVANGTRQLEATIVDSASQKGKATRKVKVANTTTPPPPPPTPAPPPTPPGLTVSITDPLGGRTLSGTNWTIVWVTGATAGSNVYTLTAGGRTVATFTTTSTGPVSIPWDTATVANGSQVLTASVRDSGGRTGSAKVTVTLKNAIVPPLTASITSPAASATVKGTVTVALTSSGGTGTRTYRLALDGALVATSASHTWDTTRAANGSHTLVATVTDGAGHTATASRTVTVSNPASAAGLDVFITQPLAAAAVRGTAWVVLWVEGAKGASNTFTLAVDGVTVGTYTTAGHGPVTIPWTTTSKANGNHTVTAHVHDATGKTGSTSIIVAVRN